MKILFCLSVYEIFEDRCFPLTVALKDRGHDVRCVINYGNVSGPTYTAISRWANFEMGPIIDFNPDLIILWNAHFDFMYAACKWLRKRYRVAVMEMGWFNRKTHSYLLDDLAQISPLADLPYVAGVATQPKNQEALEGLRACYDTSLADVCLPQNYVFVPMQLDHDTQITYTSSFIKTMDSLVGYIKHVLPKVPIVVRNHPLSLVIPRDPDVLNLTEQSPSLPLAMSATLTVGVNSTLLAEILLFRRPVVALGKHAAERAFLGSSTILQTYLSLRDGYQAPNWDDHCDYRSLLLMQNQWSTTEIPGWLIDKIEALDFSPRIPS